MGILETKKLKYVGISWCDGDNGKIMGGLNCIMGKWDSSMFDVIIKDFRLQPMNHD